jgi:serine/threonine protein kinase
MQEDFDIGELISKGSFGVVYKAIRKSELYRQSMQTHHACMVKASVLDGNESVARKLDTNRTPAADKRVFALKQVKLAGMKRVDRQEAIDEVSKAAYWGRFR